MDASDADSDAEFGSYPIIWGWTRGNEDQTPPGTILRNSNFLLAHCGFFFFNLINIACILVFHGFVFRRLFKNFLMPVALLACIGQLISCTCSIHRYNTNDEFGYWAHGSILVGLVGYTFFNYVILNVLLNCYRRGSFLKIRYTWVGMVVWIAIGIGCWFISRANWEEDNFKSFRLYISLSTAFQLVSYISVLWAFCHGKIALPNDSPFSYPVATRVLQACIFLILLAIACAFSGNAIFQYPATGMTFSVMVVVVSLVGEMDCMNDHKIPAALDNESPAVIDDEAPVALDDDTKAALSTNKTETSG